MSFTMNDVVRKSPSIFLLRIFNPVWSLFGAVGKSLSHSLKKSGEGTWRRKEAGDRSKPFREEGSRQVGQGNHSM